MTRHTTARAFLDCTPVASAAWPSGDVTLSASTTTPARQLWSLPDASPKRVFELTRDTPFLVTSVVVGNIQYPEEVANAVSAKMAATQVLERKQTEIAIEEREKQTRIVQAEGIARSMEIINTRLTSQYLQHESIEAQKAMVGSPNHTTIYIPVGPMGVPIVGTFDAQGQPKK
jgi:regulator of protease activity HflC (stomatin/prohibitin superfamily)